MENKIDNCIEKIKIPLLVLIILGLAIFALSRADAATLYSQPNTNGSTTFFSQTDYTSFGFTIPNFIATGTIAAITLPVYISQPVNNAYIYIYDSDPLTDCYYTNPYWPASQKYLNAGTQTLVLNLKTDADADQSCRINNFIISTSTDLETLNFISFKFPLGSYFYTNTSGTAAISLYSTDQAPPVSTSSATGQLIFPTANTINTTWPDFDYWVFTANNLTSTENYFSKITYTLASTTNPYEPAQNFQTYEDIIGFTSNTTSTILTIPKVQKLIPTIGPNDYTYRWTVNFSFGNNYNFTNPYSTSSYDIFVNYFSSQPTSTTSTYAGIFTSTSTWEVLQNSIQKRYGEYMGCEMSATTTYNIWNIADWKCAILSTFTGIVSSTDAIAGGTITNIVDALRAPFPFGFLAKVNGVINTYSHPSVSPPTELSFVPPGMPNSSTIVIFGASTTAWIKERSGFDYKQFIDYVLYALNFLVLLAIVIITINKMQNT